MEVITACVILILSLALLLKLFRRQKEECLSLPEPKGHPLFGNLFGHDVEKLHIVAEKWIEQYGRIFKGTLFGNTFIFLNDPQLLRHALASDVCGSSVNSRPKMFVAKYVFKNSEIVSSEYSDELLRLRKVFHGALNVYGEGKNRFEQLVQTEINRFLNKIERTNGEDFEMKTFIRHTLTNIISALLRGEIYDEGDPEVELFWEWDKWIQKLFHPSVDKVLATFPFLRHLPGKYGEIYRETIKGRDKILQRFCHDMKKSYCSEQIRGIVDFLLSLKEHEEGWLTDEMIEGLIQDSIGPALITSYATLSGLILTITQERDIQRSIQQEIDRVIGSGRPPRIEDRANMPYTVATILEFLRYASSVPLAIPHYCTGDVELEGYRIQKGSLILPNLWWIHHNEKLWKDPWVMNPRRFLDDDNNLIPTDDQGDKIYFHLELADDNVLARQWLKLVCSYILRICYKHLNSCHQRALKCRHMTRDCVNVAGLY